MVHHEGLLELDATYLFETSPNILRYREQPATIRYHDGRTTRRYTPDFELELANGTSICVEIKPVRSLLHEDVQDKLQHVAEAMCTARTPFVVLSEEHLRIEPRQSNLRWIYHHMARVSPSGDAATATLLRYGTRFPLSIRAASELLAASGIEPFSLLVAGRLRCCLNQAISYDTLLHLADEDDDGWFWISKELGF